MNYLELLNENQLKAATHIDGPCLVLAGAGSGKTRVLTARIANLMNNGVDDYNILAITFTNKAAKEMRERLETMAPGNVAFVGTFHSLGLRIIRENVAAAGLMPNFTILDSDDVLSIIKKTLKDMNYDPKQYSPAYIRNRISFIKNENLSDAELVKFFNTPPEKVALQVYESYKQKLIKNNSVDFDDLLLIPVKMFMINPEVLEKYQERFKYILIDEYQDTNEVQYRMIKLLAKKYKNLFVVGDNDQSIYGFRGANYQNILNFEKDYPNSIVILLEENYRSTKMILDAANSVIKNNTSRKDKNLRANIGDGIKTKYLRSYDEKNEITQVISEIKLLLNDGFKKENIGILYRTNAQSRIIEEQFIKASMPYKVVGSYYFYNRREIKDLISYLRLILNNHDEIALRRVINVPKRGIGPKSISDLELIATNAGITMFDALNKGKEVDFKNLILKLSKEAENLSLTELVELVLTESGIESELKNEKSLEADIRLENLMEFKSITHSFEERTGSVNLSDFLEEVSLIADISEHKEENDAVTLMTIHSAKGLEFDAVFLVGLEEGIFPHTNSFIEEGGLEEERRLCYVGITRAKKRLYLTNAKRRLLYGKETINPPSRFISEIDKNLLDIQNLSLEEPKKIDKSKYISNEDIEYNPGDIVFHDTYGTGVVIEVVKDLVSIAFNKNHGIKKLLKNYKGLKKR